MSAGAITRVQDLVVHVQFDDDQPEIGEVLIAQRRQKGLLIVNSLAPGTKAICLNVGRGRGLMKTMAVERTGRGLEIPVGKVTIGRIFDLLGSPLYGQPFPDSKEIPPRNSFKAPVSNMS